MHDLLVGIAEAVVECVVPDQDSPRWYWMIWLVVLALFLGLIAWVSMT